MIRCDRDGCGWRAIAPTESAAREQFATHLVSEHASTVDADIPDGMVQVRIGEDDEWQTVTPAEAKLLHDRSHDGPS